MNLVSATIEDNRSQKAMSPLEKKQLVSSEATPPRMTRHLSNGTDMCVPGRYDYVMKVILLGDLGVGKTSFMKALKAHPDVTKVECNCLVASPSDHLEVEVNTVLGKTACVRLYDTGGQERYRSLTSSYYRGAHGVLLMCDLTNQKSMDNIESWLSDLNSFSSASSCVRAILGSKCAAKNREVSPQVVRKYAESRALPYMEFDTTQFYNVVESLHMIVDRIAMEVTISPLNSLMIKPCLGSQEKRKLSERRQVACTCL